MNCVHMCSLVFYKTLLSIVELSYQFFSKSKGHILDKFHISFKDKIRKLLELIQEEFSSFASPAQPDSFEATIMELLQSSNQEFIPDGFKELVKSYESTDSYVY